MTSNEVMGGPSTFTMLYTTSRFHDAYPKAVAAFLRALEEAIASINADKHDNAGERHEVCGLHGRRRQHQGPPAQLAGLVLSQHPSCPGG